MILIRNGRYPDRILLALLLFVCLSVSSCKKSEPVDHASQGRAHGDKGEYDKSWQDVHKAQSLGAQLAPDFLEQLRKASGRKE